MFDVEFTIMVAVILNVCIQGYWLYWTLDNHKDKHER